MVSNNKTDRDGVLHLHSGPDEKQPRVKDIDMPKGHKPNVDLRRNEFATRLNTALDARAWVPKNKGRQIELAKKMGVSQGAARKWLEGESYPDLDKIADLALHLKINSDWLLTGRGDMDIDRKPTSDINEALLAEVMEFADQRTHGITMTSAQRARLVMVLYEMATKDGHVDAAMAESVIRLLR